MAKILTASLLRCDWVESGLTQNFEKGFELEPDAFDNLVERNLRYLQKHGDKDEIQIIKKTSIG